MPIAEADIRFKYSTKSGAAGNSTAQADPNVSLGKYISTTEIPDATLHSLYDPVSGEENTAGDVEYRCLFIHNTHATLTLLAPAVWITGQDAGGVDYAVGLDPAAASPIGQVEAQAAEVAAEGDAPAGVAFSAPASKGAGLALGDLGPGQCRALWFRRTANNTAAVNPDGVSFRVEGDTDA